MTTVLHAAKLYPPAGGGMETVLRDLCDGTAGVWNVAVLFIAEIAILDDASGVGAFGA